MIQISARKFLGALPLAVGGARRGNALAPICRWAVAAVIALVFGPHAHAEGLEDAPASNVIWVANASADFAVLLPLDGWSGQQEVWEYEADFKMIERVDFKHINGAMLWIEVWRNPSGAGIQDWVAQHANIQTFGTSAASDVLVGVDGISALQYGGIERNEQSFGVIQTLFVRGDRIYRVNYLARDGGVNRDVYDQVLAYLSFSLSSDWMAIADLNEMTSAIESSRSRSAPTRKVYSCGGEVDTCPCGASNPFPCCSYGNCTWYAWHRACCDWGLNIPPRGNANTWAASFNADPNYEVTSDPRVGDVACSGSGTWGHVAFVTAVSGNTITVMEQNCDYSATRSWTYNKSYFTHGYARPKPKTGNLKVTINPAAARTAGAQWRRTGTSTWRNSDYTETGLSPGSKTVEFKAISNWDQPANASVTVSAGQTATMSKSYVRHTGSLTVTINPADARTAGAQWRRTGTSTWRTSGATESGIETGTYTIEFSALASPWIKPANVSVTIAKNATASASVRYNRPPVLAAPGSHFVHVGSLLQFPVTATDADGDAITLSLTGAPSGAVLSATGGVGTLRFTPSGAQAGGLYTLNFKATDALGATNGATAIVSVGDWPRIQPIPPQRALVGQLLEFDVMASDTNGDAIVLSVSNAPSGALFDPGDGQHGVFRFTPDFAQGGDVYDLLFTASDADGVFTASVTLIVGAPPVVAPLEDVAIRAGQTALFTVTASDPNGDPKTFGMNGAPPGAALTGSGDTRVFSYTALESDKGQQFEIEFVVSDLDGAASTRMHLHIQGPPEFVEIPPQRIAVTNRLELTIQAVDPDGDAMIFAISNAPPGATFTANVSGGVFLYTPALEEGTHSYTARFYATAIDGVGIMDVPILVGVPPELAAPETAVVAKYNTLEFEVQATDLDGDPIEFSATPLPPNAEFSATGYVGVFHFQPAAFQGGQEYRVVFTADDGVDGYASREVDVRVMDDDMYEQNDSREQAVDFNSFKGVSRPAKQADDDWYFVDLPFGQQRVSVTVQFAAAAGDMQISLYNAQGEQVGQSAPSVSGAVLQMDSPYFGRHYIRIHGENMGNGYALHWDCADSWDGCSGPDDDYAPNQSRENASPIVLGKWLSEQRGTGIAGDPDWFSVNIPAGEEYLSVTGVYGQIAHPLRLEVYAPGGELVGTADGDGGVLVWQSALEVHGVYVLKIRAVNDPACIPYDLIAHSSQRANLPVEFLTGRYLRLPVSVAGYPGLWLALDPSEGARYNPEGTGGRAGADFWGNVPALVNQVVGVGGTIIRTNGASWFDGPTVTRLNEGTWNRLSIEGEPVEGLFFRRLLEFEYGDSALVVRDRLVNGTGADLTSVVTMDSVNPTPDYPFSEVRTSNDVLSVLGATADLVAAASTRAGRVLAFGSASPLAVPDASFLSRQNPYVVLAAPNDPNGAVANLAIKLAMNYGTLEEGQTNEALWYAVFAESSEKAADLFQVAVMRNEWADDAFEPNNGVDDAFDLQTRSGEWIRAIQANDDWYAIQVPIGIQDVSVRLKFEAAHGNMQMALYTQSGQELCASEPAADGAMLSCIAPAHGTVLLRVSGEDAGNVYDLQWSALSSWGGCTEASDDVLEPNNTRTNASLLPAGVWMATQLGEMLSAGDDDWFVIDVAPEQVSLTITCSHYAAHGDLAVELYDEKGELLHRVDTPSDVETLSYTVPREGLYYVRIAPPDSGATCNLYDLFWSGTPDGSEAVTNVIHLYGRHLYLPIQTTNEPGRFVTPDRSAGLRFDNVGSGLDRGVDIWRQLAIPAAHYIAWDNARVVTNGRDWTQEGVVEKLSAGTLNHARISGMPREHLRYQRDVTFLDEDQTLTVQDVFANEGPTPITHLVTMDAFDPNPDFDQGVVNTRNYIVALFSRPEMALAEAVDCGITLALASRSPYVVPDASFLSRQNPYTVLNDPNDPAGQVANHSLKLLMNYGSLAAGSSVTGVWQIVVASSRAEAISLWRSATPELSALIDRDETGLPDWWEIANFGGPSDPDADSDGDRMNNRSEYLAGTDPNDPQSVFRLEITDAPLSAEPLLRWNVQQGRRATLLRGTNVYGPFDPVSSAPRDPGRHSVTDRWDVLPDRAFYFLRLDEPHE